MLICSIPNSFRQIYEIDSKTVLQYWLNVQSAKHEVTNEKLLMSLYNEHVTSTTII